jgi:hypothetical protein
MSTLWNIFIFLSSPYQWNIFRQHVNSLILKGLLKIQRVSCTETLKFIRYQQKEITQALNTCFNVQRNAAMPNAARNKSQASVLLAGIKR